MTDVLKLYVAFFYDNGRFKGQDIVQILGLVKHSFKNEWTLSSVYRTALEWCVMSDGVCILTH